LSTIVDKPTIELTFCLFHWLHTKIITHEKLRCAFPEPKGKQTFWKSQTWAIWV